MFTLQTEYILGLKIYHGELKIKPCVPKDWNEFEVVFRWKNANYNIKYERKNETSQMYLNGEKVDEIKLNNEGEFEVKVEF